MKVLKARKGDAWGYAAMLIEQCESEAEIPEFLREIVAHVDAALAPAPEAADATEHEPDDDEDDDAPAQEEE